MSRHKKLKPKARRFTKAELEQRRVNRLLRIDAPVLRVVLREKRKSVSKIDGVVAPVTARTTPKRAKKKRKAERAAARAAAARRARREEKRRAKAEAA